MTQGVIGSRVRDSGKSGSAQRDDSAIVFGTRGSALALWQTNYVVDRLREAQSALPYRIDRIRTKGDRTQASSVPLSQLGDKSMFVAELEQALLAGTVDVAVHPMNDRLLVEAEADGARRGIDIAVHSLKDLPGQLPHELVIAAITSREDARDVLVTRDGRGFRDLPTGARIGTGSLRRRAQLLHLRPDLRIEEIRGNVDTRISKALAADGPDGIVLAAAGVLRLGLECYIVEYFATDVIVPAVGQGALALEVRRGDHSLRRLARAVDDYATRQAVMAERAVLRSLGGGCQVPIGAHATIQGDGSTLRLVAVVATPDGNHVIRAERTAPITQPVRLGRAVARNLRERGASAILRAVLAGAG